MRFHILTSAIVILPVLLSSCNSSKSTESETAPDLTGLDDFKGIANGKVTIGGKVFPIEFTASAYSKQVSLTGFTDLADQEKGWYLFIAAKTTTTSPQDIDEGWNQAVLSYSLSWASTQCVYSGKVGTVTIESFIAKKNGTKNYFITSGKASFNATRSNTGNYSPVDCPNMPVEATFSNIGVYDSGLNL